jgi:Holliday junction resolvase
MLESAVERELCDRVTTLGGLCIKMQASGRRGFCDRLVVLPGGRIHFVELKRPRGGRLSPHQTAYIKAFSRLGATIVVVRSSKDIDSLLNS